MKKNKKNQKGFTLIELLVVIAIIAILAVVVVLTLNPAELLRQARDSNRISDFATLKSALGLYSEDVNTTTPMYGPGGTPSDTFYTAYGSATNVIAAYTGNTAVTYGFTATTSVNTYVLPVCTISSRLVDGTGWIPINFTAITSGAPIGTLPIDPTNKGGLIYVYGATSTSYKLSTKMESAKYVTGGTADVQTNDGGNNVNAYEQGSNMQL